MSDANTRKLLFILFSDDPCRQNHALMYALDLHRKGYQVRLLLEGLATKMIGDVATGESRTAQLLRDALEAGIVAGACARAAAGCASQDPSRDVADLARAHGIELLSQMDGHASIEPLVRSGYEIIPI